MNHPILPFTLSIAISGILSGCYISTFVDNDSDSSNGSGTAGSEVTGGSDSATPTDSDADTNTNGDTLPGSDAETDTDIDTGTELYPRTVWLLGPPMVHSPTVSSFRVNAVLNTEFSTGDKEQVRLFFRPAGTENWTRIDDRTFVGDDIIEWTVSNVASDTIWDYVITETLDPHMGADLFTGRAVTQRTSLDDTFSFALLTDAHIAPLDFTMETTDYAAVTLKQIGKDLLEGERPDFALHLGDQLDFHLFGFNDPPPDGTYTRKGYLNYRQFMSDSMGLFAHFNLVGNWDGETGCFTSEEINRSREQRMLYMPAPDDTTYPQGGNEYQDYYAFTWGDALFVVLNVMTYTPTCHALSEYPGLADDWTLGAPQMSWLESTLSNATSKWKFIFIHHAVGGAAGDSTNSAYGRGGGQAAYVGEQAVVHEMMLRYNVQIFFYGHDHVFMDMVVDGIHYTLPGGAGAPWMFSSYITGYPEGEYYPASGHARVEVGPDTTHVEFLGLENTELYSFTVFPY